MFSIVFVVPNYFSFRAFIEPHCIQLKDFYSVSVIGRFSCAEIALIDKSITVFNVPMSREINFLLDLECFWRIYRIVRFGVKADAIHSITSKCGLLTMVVGILGNRKNRVHTFTGQAWVGKELSCVKRLIVKCADYFIARAATHVLVDSHAQLEVLRANGILSSVQGKVFASGSICGVDLDKFFPSNELRRTMRANLGISDDKFVLIFAGRLVREKGVSDLMHIASRLERNSDFVLLILGPDIDNYRQSIKEHKNMIYVGERHNLNDYFACADLLLVPSYREGFCNVIIEAGATGLQTLSYDIYGVKDAIKGSLGITVDPGDTDSMIQSIEEVKRDPHRRNSAKKRRERVRQYFDQSLLTRQMIEFYRKIL